MRAFSLSRVGAILMKELIQMRRDRLTFAMMVGIPIIQLILFGFAINTDPKHLPAAAVIEDTSRFGRSVFAAMQNSRYFDFIATADSENQAKEMLARGDVSFVVTVPTDFGRDLIRGIRPELLLEADATDPAAASGAVGAINQIVSSGLAHDLRGPLETLKQDRPPVEVVVHRRYNPEGVTQYNIVPGLLGVVLAR